MHRSTILLSPTQYRVGVLGASGAVGTRFLSRLHDHPWFKVVALGGAPAEIGRPYKEIADKVYNACLDPNGIPAEFADTKIIDPDPKGWKSAGVDFVFSAVPDEVARTAEEAFANAGLPVFSNSPENRMKTLVPLLQPYVNPAHIQLAKLQSSYMNAGGFVATNPNCSTIAMTVGLKPIHEKYGIESVHATTLQATSGSGFPGLSIAEMQDNCVPYIGNEEEKMEEESAKIFGNFAATNGKEEPIKFDDIKVSAICNRVPISNGHMICVSVKLKKQPKNIEEVKEVFRNFRGSPETQGLPSCPERPIRFFEDDRPDRPQHRLDRDYANGMGVSVGRVRKCTINDIKYTILGHNTVIGAAGGSILNAELACKLGLVKSNA